MHIAVAPGLRRFDRGRILLGGTPKRLLRLTEAGAAAFDRWSRGDPVRAGSEAALGWRLVDAGMADPVVEVTDGVGAASDLTVVVPVQGRATQLDVCLDRLRSAHGESRIIVVDDASPDAAEIAAVVERRGAELVRRERCGGPAVARNDGLAAVTSPLVAFVDSDVEVAANWDGRLRALCALDGVAVAAPRVVASPGRRLRERYEMARCPLDLGGRPAAVGPGGRVSYVPAAALVARVEVLRAVGGFDPTLRVGEDVDLVWRVHAAGWRVRYEPSVRVVHREPVERGGLRRWAERRMAYGTSAAALEARHPRSAPPVVISPWSAAVWGFVIAGCPAAAATVVAATAVGLARKLDGVPPSVSIGLAARGHLQAAEATLRALIRPWWPATLLLASRSRRVRRVALAAVLVAPVLDHRRGRVAVPLGPWIALRALDDIAYGWGVWLGAARGRSIAALLPRSPGTTGEIALRSVVIRPHNV